MVKIIKSNSKIVKVNVNGRTYNVENEDLQNQLSFMEKIIPEPKQILSFAKTTDKLNQL